MKLSNQFPQAINLVRGYILQKLRDYRNNYCEGYRPIIKVRCGELRRMSRFLNETFRVRF